jgi:hypothetical protein
MEATLDAVPEVAANPDAGEQPATAQPDDGAIESRLAEEISELWSSHVRLSGNRKATAKELRLVRARLAERLFAMKQILCRAGRAGQWRSWLRQQHIPRSTADRLAMRHAETLGGGNDGNVLSGAISQPGEADAWKLAKNVWLRVGKLLTTDESVMEFIGCFAELAGVGHELRAEGLVILKSVPKPADEVPASAPETGAAPQPSGEAPAAVKEPEAEAAATPTESGQAAAAADAGSGAVA